MLQLTNIQSPSDSVGLPDPGATEFFPYRRAVEMGRRGPQLTGQAGWRAQHGQNHWVLLLPLSSLSFPVSIKIGCLVTAASIVGLALPATWARERRQTRKSDLEQKPVDRVNRDWGTW